MIDSPTADEALQGSVDVVGTANSPGFASAELAFAYASDDSDTWFVIEELAEPVTNGVIAGWDTTQVSDGEYVLRLRVNSLDGTLQESTVPVQIRNYTAPAVETISPTATVPNPLQVPTAVVLPASPSAVPNAATVPSALPPNPAAATESGVFQGFARGALVAAGLAVVLGIMLLRRRP
jgi:hypothetical protein